MPTFLWEGRTAQGKVLKGEMEAPNQAAVLVRLRSQRIQPNAARVREKGKGLDKELTIPGFGPKIKPRDVTVFTRQFATMIDAGLPIVQSLEILAQQTDNKAFQEALRTIKQDVEGGLTLADSMRKYPKAFDDLYVNMVAAGEAGGVLTTILNRIAVFMEKSAKLRKKVKGAMIYPCTIIAVAVIVVAILLLYVIPVFAELYSGMGRALPAMTQMTINVSHWFRDYFIYLVAVLGAAVVALRVYYKTEDGRAKIDALLLKLPIFGDLLRKVAVARFAQNMSILLSSGVPMLEGLAITARTAGNKVIEKSVMLCRLSVSQGRTLSEPLTESGIFPPMVCQMVAVGESTGALDSMLKRVADFFEEEVDEAVANLTALMEPAIMIVLGIILGALVISMYLPIFQLGSLVS
ncbi:MAG TPA: type II secretion system F family protein [Candidatus Acidoferrales bacterium]|nr:type II secretion system F family protein [Candidatus Acidoferrales bacterium]